MCDTCNNKKWFRQCVKCKNKLCIECFKTHNKDYVNSCPYCRNDAVEHNKIRNMMDDMLSGTTTSQQHSKDRVKIEKIYYLSNLNCM